MALTTDPNDPCLQDGRKQEGQNSCYLVLTEEERKKGFVRPYRDAYRHRVCGTITTMGKAIAETYSRNPSFYGATFCIKCNAHHPVGEFTWYEMDGSEGPIVGS
jgi:hypothetical protein